MKRHSRDIQDNMPHCSLWHLSSGVPGCSTQENVTNLLSLGPHGDFNSQSSSHWGGLDGKEAACSAGDLVQSLGWEDPLEKEMATHSSILAWRIPWMEEPGRLQSMGSQRVGHDWATSLSLVFWSYLYISEESMICLNILNIVHWYNRWKRMIITRE